MTKLILFRLFLNKKNKTFASHLIKQLNLMTKQLFFLAILFLGFTATAQVVEDSVEMGPNYTSDVFYSLTTGTKTHVGGADWTVGFYNEAISAAIMINSGRGVNLYKYSDNIVDFSTIIDTTGNINTWTKLYDDPEKWDANSAFEGEPTSSTSNYGWGNYSGPPNHAVTASRIFVIETQGGNMYKVMVVDKTNGTFTYRYAALDNSFDTTIVVTPADYLNKNYVYLNMDNHTLLDFEPNNTAWDLQFTRYRDFLPSYGIEDVTTGALINEGIEVIAITNLPSADAEITIADTGLFTGLKNSVGHYWKDLDFSQPGPPQWYTFDSTTYFIKNIDGNIYKLYFTHFGGQSNGKINFKTEQIQLETGINNIESVISYTVYPNPTKGQVELVLDLKANEDLQIAVSDMFGRTVYQSSTLNANAGLNAYKIDLGNQTNGVYVVQLSNGKSVTTKKILLNK